MKGIVVEIDNATVEFESYTDEVGIRHLSIRIHNDSGQHALIRLDDPEWLIFEEEDGSPREVELPIQPPLPGMEIPDSVAIYEEGKRVDCFHTWPGCNCGR
jgi:hypothetical protein